MHRILTYLGTIPILAAASFAEYNFIFSYCLVIIGFMSGILWGISLKSDAKLFIVSNIITLTAWFAYLQNNNMIKIAVFILCFLHLILIDYIMFRKNLIEKDYMILRLKVSIIVISSLLIYLSKIWI